MNNGNSIGYVSAKLQLKNKLYFKQQIVGVRTEQGVMKGLMNI